MYLIPNYPWVHQNATGCTPNNYINRKTSLHGHEIYHSLKIPINNKCAGKLHSTLDKTVISILWPRKLSSFFIWCIPSPPLHGKHIQRHLYAYLLSAWLFLPIASHPPTHPTPPAALHPPRRHHVLVIALLVYTGTTRFSSLPHKKNIFLIPPTAPG